MTEGMRSNVSPSVQVELWISSSVDRVFDIGKPLMIEGVLSLSA